jgi:hypothetical protein
MMSGWFRLFFLLAFFSVLSVVVWRYYRNGVMQDDSVAVALEDHPYFIQIILEDTSSGIRWEWKREAHGSFWKMVQPLEWPANPFFIDQLLSDLFLFQNSSHEEFLSSLEKFPNSQKNLSFISASGNILLEFDEHNIWERERKICSPLLKNWKAIRNPSLKEVLITKIWDLDLPKIDGMILEFPKKEGKYIFSKQKNKWIAENLAPEKLSTGKVEDFLSWMSKLEVDQFLPEQLENASALGFQMPDCRLTLLSRNETHILEIGKSFCKKSHLRFAKIAPYETVFALPCGFLHDLMQPYIFFAEDQLNDVL